MSHGVGTPEKMRVTAGKLDYDTGFGIGEHDPSATLYIAGYVFDVVEITSRCAMKVKVNIPVRLKNPWFWVGIASVVIAALGVDPQQFVSWDSLGGYIVDVLKTRCSL